MIDPYWVCPAAETGLVLNKPVKKVETAIFIPQMNANLQVKWKWKESVSFVNI